ncbi:MAG: hypothetical protein ACK4PI_13065 [Tepidisphaerales bacterium]
MHPDPDRDLLELRRLARHRTVRHPEPVLLGNEAVRFYRFCAQRQKPAMLAISRICQQLIPELFHPHLCIEGFQRGTLTLMLDSAAHLYELRQLLLAGLERQLLLAGAPHGLRRITLKRGRWYDPDTGLPRFDTP